VERHFPLRSFIRFRYPISDEATEGNRFAAAFEIGGFHGVAALEKAADMAGAAAE
jgi:hypothetical protein